MLIVCDFVYLFWSKESASFTHWNAKETTPFCSRNLASLAKIACRVKGDLRYNQRHQQLFNGHLHQTYQSSLNNKSEWVSCLQGKAKIGLGLDKDRFILYWKIWSSQCTYLWSFNAYKFFCPTFAVWWNIASLSLSKLVKFLQYQSCVWFAHTFHRLCTFLAHLRQYHHTLVSYQLGIFFLRGS